MISRCRHWSTDSAAVLLHDLSSNIVMCFFFFKQKTAYEIGLGIPAEPLFRSNDGSNKLNRSRKARVSYKVQRTINASLNAATSTRAVSSNPNFVTRQKIEIIFG